MKRKCANCKLFDENYSVCQYVAPPVIRRLHDMLQAEGMTEMAYRATYDERPVPTEADFCCSEHKMKSKALN